MFLNVNRKRCLALIVTAAFLVLNLVNVIPVQASTDQDIAGAWDKALKYSQDNPAKLNSFFSPWMSALALGAKGDPLINSVTVSISDITTPDTIKPVELSRSIIASLAQGKKPSDMITLLVSKQKNEGCFGETNDTLNNTIWSVIALDMYNCNYSASPANYNFNNAVNFIKNKQDSTGGFDEGGWGVDADSTAHALLALAGRITTSDLCAQKALAYLKKQQLSNGAIGSWGSDSPDSTAAVIEALIALNISPQGTDWTTNGKTLVDGLLAHQQQDGGFVEQKSYLDNKGVSHFYEANSMGSALCALVDLVNGYSKYRTRLPLVWLKVTGTTLISNGQDCDLTVTVKNPNANAKDNLIIAALYDPQGKMVTYSYAQYHLSAGEERTSGLGFGSNIVAGSQVKVMVWDNWQQRTPLCSPVVIPVQ